MVINAHSKLNLFIQNYGSSITPRVQKLAKLSDLVTAIFFVFQGYCGVDSEQNTSLTQPLLHVSQSMTGVAPSPTVSVLRTGSPETGTGDHFGVPNSCGQGE